jgi:hypothetical protein
MKRMTEALTAECTQATVLAVERPFRQVHHTHDDHGYSEISRVTHCMFSTVLPGVVKYRSVGLDPDQKVGLRHFVELGSSRVGEIHVRVPHFQQDCAISDQHTHRFVVRQPRIFPKLLKIHIQLKVLQSASCGVDRSLQGPYHCLRSE